jgi:hypothetical protein
VTRDEVYYQSRQMKLNGMPDAQMDNVLRDFARLYGNFVLEGELTFLDYAGNEHMSGAQALEINQKAGYDRHLPVMKYYVFNCIWREGWPEGMNYGQMVDEGTKIAEALSCTCSTIEAVPTYGTVPNKSAMALKQDNQGREGEVFFDPSMPYTPGKNTNDTFVRTKYYVEFPAWVIGFTPTTAAGHAFGAMTIQSLDGDLLGNIGTGFTRDEKRQLLARFQAEGSFQVEIRSQRMSEYGRTRHGRFLRIL